MSEDEGLRPLIISGDTKKCSMCVQYLPFDQFYPSKTGRAGLSSRCKACTKEHTKRWLTWNPERRQIHRKRNKQKLAEAIHAAKDRPCSDCGGEYPPYILDFDHRDPSQKVGGVSKIGALPQRLAEIEKCDVVCANCHRERTWRRGDHLYRRT